MNILSNFSTGSNHPSVHANGDTKKKLAQGSDLLLPEPAKMSQMVDQSVEGSDSRKAPTTKEAFSDFVGQTFFGHLMSSMRATVEKPAYFHGGRGEEVFQGQLDQLMVENMSKASSKTFAEPMYDLFMMQRS